MQDSVPDWKTGDGSGGIGQSRPVDDDGTTGIPTTNGGGQGRGERTEEKRFSLVAGEPDQRPQGRCRGRSVRASARTRLGRGHEAVLVEAGEADRSGWGGRVEEQQGSKTRS